MKASSKGGAAAASAAKAARTPRARSSEAAAALLRSRGRRIRRARARSEVRRVTRAVGVAHRCTLLVMPTPAQAPLTLGLEDFRAARARIAPHVKHTPLLGSRQLSELTGYDVRLKAEVFQRVGSYKIRGPLNKFALMSEEDKRRGVVCSSAGNHAQGVALAAKIHGIRAVVCMAENATPSKIAATRGYGAEVVLHGTIWDEANEKAKALVKSEGLTYVHPFDDPELIAGQGTLGLEIVDDWPVVDAVIVPIGGGGLISGVSMVVKAHNPNARIIGVESSDGPAMKRSLEAGRLETIDCRTAIDGLRGRAAGPPTPTPRLAGGGPPAGRPRKRPREAARLETIDCRTVIDGLRVRRAGE